MESYNTILMSPRAVVDAAKEAADCDTPDVVDNLQWFLVGNNRTFTNLDEHLILDHELNPVRDCIHVTVYKISE